MKLFSPPVTASTAKKASLFGAFFQALVNQSIYHTCFSLTNKNQTYNEAT